MNKLITHSGLAPLDVIRVEAALSRYPIHRLAKQGTVLIELGETNADGELTLRWEVGHHSKYGQPGPLAYKIDTLIVNRKLEGAGRPISKIIRLGSLREIAEATGTGEGNTMAIKNALHQNASAYITATIRYRSADGAERRIEIGDTRYAVVFAGETLPDGRKADAVYAVLHDFYREILDHAQTRPLDYDYLRALPPAPQRLYELLSYPMFGALKHGKPKARLGYAEFCRFAPLMRSLAWERVRVQMAKIHAPHRKSGYLAGVEFEATTDRDGRPDWTMIYTPGPKAKAEYRAFTGKGGSVALDVGPAQPEPRPQPEPEPTGLEHELVGRGVTRSVAAELVRDFPEERIRAQVAWVDWLRRKQPTKIVDVGAYLAEAIRKDYAPPAGFEDAAQRAERERIAREREDQARTAKARAREERDRIDAYWHGLTPEQQARLEAEALEQADPAARASCAIGSAALRQMARCVLREAHIRRVLGLSAVD